MNGFLGESPPLTGVGVRDVHRVGGAEHSTVSITGAAGTRATLSAALAGGYRTVGRGAGDADFLLIQVDSTSDESVAKALQALRKRIGGQLARHAPA